ncbi:MAG: ECF transporter S component [Oscillospiraceae bacterium]|jgi:riboflavin transporter FmnP|nr:ECF transporter S component [Oscillospiraceae bacterium]
MKQRTRKIAVVGVMSAIAIILEFLEFAVPVMPGFIKLDFSELPALITAFALGPISGTAICLIKNLFHLFTSSTGGVGELANFIIGAAFVIPAGIIYHRYHDRRGAVLGALIGAVIMAIASIPLNYFVTYPVYYNFLPKEAIVAAYQAIYPRVNSILECLIVFNMPFTFVKGLISAVVTIFIYKRLSPILKGKHQ